MNRSISLERLDAEVPSGWLTRAEAAKLLGISKSRVQQLEERGELRSIKDDRGRCRYDPAEVLEVAERRKADGIPSSSELDLLFEMFREHRTVLEIRRATRLSSETLMRLYAEYRTPIDHHYERESQAREEAAMFEHERRLRDLARPIRHWRDEEK